MTTGQTLKQKLGLNSFKQVRLTRALISTFKTYLIFYNSRRPNFPITQRTVLHGYMPSQLMIAPLDRRPVYTPLMSLESFNGSLTNAFFFVVDLAGQFAKPDELEFIVEKTTSKPEKYPLLFGKLEEFVTMADLANAASSSNLTKAFRKRRNDLIGTENKLAKLIDVFIDEADKSVTFAFLTTVTPYPDDPDYKWKELDPDDFSLDNNRSKTYELQIKVLEFFDWLETSPDLTEVKGKDIKDILQVSNVQVFSTSPSFHWQGQNYFLSQLDASIHPTDIAPKHWNHATRHGSDPYFLDKHLYGFLRSIDFFQNPMASMLTKKLKDRDLI